MELDWVVIRVQPIRKMLAVAAIGLVAAALAISATRDVTDRFARTMVVSAAVVMIVVYLVPHSLRGSQLDYDKLDAGESAHDAIGTGR